MYHVINHNISAEKLLSLEMESIHFYPLKWRDPRNFCLNAFSKFPHKHKGVLIKWFAGRLHEDNKHFRDKWQLLKISKILLVMFILEVRLRRYHVIVGLGPSGWHFTKPSFPRIMVWNGGTFVSSISTFTEIVIINTCNQVRLNLQLKQNSFLRPLLGIVQGSKWLFQSRCLCGSYEKIQGVSHKYIL